MALTDYSGLSAGVFSRLNRTADTADFDVAISLAEAEINRRLARQPVSGAHARASMSLSTEYVAFPTNLIDVDSMTVEDGGDTFVILPTSPQNMADMFARLDTTDRPEFYTTVGTEFRFWPEPDATYTVTLTGWFKVALTSVGVTNWLLTDHPDVYFHGVLAHLHQQYFDEKAAEVQASLFDAALEKMLASYPSRPDRRPLRSDISPQQLSGWRSVLV